MQDKIKKLINSIDFENDRLLAEIYKVIKNSGDISEDKEIDYSINIYAEDCEDISHLILEKLLNKLTSTAFNTWIKPTKFYMYKEYYIIAASNSFTRDILEKRYLDIIKTILQLEYDELKPIKFSVNGLLVDGYLEEPKMDNEEIIKKIKQEY